MGYKQLNIKNPCTQPLENMGHDEASKFCKTCNHVVMDFSNLTNAELVEMLQNTKYSCGIFDKNQLGTLYYQEDQITFKRKNYWRGVAAAIIAGTLQLTSTYSQNPNKPYKLLNEDLRFDKNPTQKSIGNSDQKNDITKKEKFEFQVLDAETKSPLQYVSVEMMGISGVTDSLGKISFDFAYKQDSVVSFVANLSSYRYRDEKVRLRLQNCYKKTTVMYLRRENKNSEVIYGFY